MTCVQSPSLPPALEQGERGRVTQKLGRSQIDWEVNPHFGQPRGGEGAGRFCREERMEQLTFQGPEASTAHCGPSVQVSGRNRLVLSETPAQPPAFPNNGWIQPG